MSQFLSTNISYCFHEKLSNSDHRAFQDMINFSYEYVGSADTNPVSFAKTKKHIGPMVIIHRPKEDVRQSIFNAFDPHEAFSDSEWEKYVTNILDRYEIFLDFYKQSNLRLSWVSFRDLESEDVLYGIFRFLIPTYRPSKDYIHAMNKLKITVKHRDGMKWGIEAGRHLNHLSIEDFKKTHLEDFDREKFKLSVWNDWK